MFRRTRCSGATRRSWRHERADTDHPRDHSDLPISDAPRAIEFLQNAFGFEKHAVYPNPDGSIAHAQLTLGPYFIMLGSAREDEAWPSRTPRQLGGATGGVYVVLEGDEDVDAHFARARAAGARITREPESPDYGGRNYSAEDSEGYLWSFGSYRPKSVV